MTDWSELVRHIKGNYIVDGERDGVLQLVFDLASGRRQTVLIVHHMLMGGPVTATTKSEQAWAQIVAPIGTMSDIQLPRLVRAAGAKVCGGIGARGDFVTYQHGFPLRNIDSVQFDTALVEVIGAADQLAGPDD